MDRLNATVKRVKLLLSRCATIWQAAMAMEPAMKSLMGSVFATVAGLELTAQSKSTSLRILRSKLMEHNGTTTNSQLVKPLSRYLSRH